MCSIGSSSSLYPVILPIFDPAFKANPYPFYESLRISTEISRIRLPSGVEAWITTSYPTAKKLLRDTRLSKHPISGQCNKPHQVKQNVTHPLFNHLLMMDPPLHTSLRNVLTKAFITQRVEANRSRVRAIATSLLDEIASRGEADLITEFAYPLPFEVICEIVGIPTIDRAFLSQSLQDLETFDLNDPERVPIVAQRIFGYLSELALSIRSDIKDNLLCLLVTAKNRGEITGEQLPSLIFLMLAAGHETTTNLIGNGIFALLNDQSSWTHLCSEPTLVSQIVEELLRFNSPLEMTTARYATEDILINNVMINAGDMIFVGLAAANHDPDQFLCPGRLDITRVDAPPHLAFGHGIHTCLGAGLARLVGEIAFRELSIRFPDLQLSNDSSNYYWKPGLITRGLFSLPVRFKSQPCTK